MENKNLIKEVNGDIFKVTIESGSREFKGRQLSYTQTNTFLNGAKIDCSVDYEDGSQERESVLFNDDRKATEYNYNFVKDAKYGIVEDIFFMPILDADGNEKGRRELRYKENLMEKRQETYCYDDIYKSGEDCFIIEKCLKHNGKTLTKRSITKTNGEHVEEYEYEKKEYFDQNKRELESEFYVAKKNDKIIKSIRNEGNGTAIKDFESSIGNYYYDKSGEGVLSMPNQDRINGDYIEKEFEANLPDYQVEELSVLQELDFIRDEFNKLNDFQINLVNSQNVSQEEFNQ